MILETNQMILFHRGINASFEGIGWFVASEANKDCILVIFTLIDLAFCYKVIDNFLVNHPFIAKIMDHIIVGFILWRQHKRLCFFGLSCVMTGMAIFIASMMVSQASMKVYPSTVTR